MVGDPLEIEIDDGPEDVGDPGAVVLFGLDQPLGILEEDISAERRAICTSLRTPYKPKTNISTYPRPGNRSESLGREAC